MKKENRVRKDASGAEKQTQPEKALARFQLNRQHDWFLAQLNRILHLKARDACDDLEGVARSIQLHPHLKKECQAMQWVADGVFWVKYLAMLDESDGAEGMRLQFSPEERWLSTYCHLLRDFGLETMLNYTIGMGAVLQGCEIHANGRDKFARMERGWHVLHQAIERADDLAKELSQSGGGK